MKKIFLLIINFLVLSLLIQVIIICFTTKFTTKYSLKTTTNEYLIEEYFKKENNISTYNFIITTKTNKKYTFKVQKNFNKQKHIIKDIKYFKEGNVECLYPLFKRNYTSDVSCYYNKTQVSYSYLNQLNNKNIKKISSKLKKLGYKTNISSTPNPSKKYKNLVVYQKNIPNNYIFTTWNYKGIDILKSNDLSSKQFLKNDKYENSLAIICNDYYIYIDNTKKEIKEIKAYNMLNQKQKEFKLNDLSADIYFNGIYNNELYITDKKTKKQYIYNPKKNKLKELNSYFILKNDKIKEVNRDTFFQKNIIFTDFIENNDISNKYLTKEIKYENNYYYFLTSNGNFYRLYSKNKTSPELLFTFPNIKEWNIKDNDIIFINNDTLYFYNDKLGLLPILKTNELKYNYKNICDFLKKK